MAVSITIRNVPESTRDALAARAASSGRSLQEYLLRRLEEEASYPDPAQALADIRARARRFPAMDAKTVVADVHADRS